MFAIAPTDLEWFSYMKNEPQARLVNFWTPTPWNVRRLCEGDRLYFMLKAPIRRIGGYGSFVRYSDMTAGEAWEYYGLGNGVSSKDELVGKIERFALKRAKSFSPTVNPVIGCIELSDVVTLDDELFVDPAYCGHPFPNEVVKLKYFNEDDRIAEILGNAQPMTPFNLVEGKTSRKSSQRKDRKGQSTFRQKILQNYNYSCCVLGETLTELLEAAHIQPYINELSNHPQNGLCLRIDLHRLFDQGLISINEQHTVIVSKRLKNTSYASLDGRKINLPKSLAAYPSVSALAYHRTNLR
jgi:putative restriction endonuclease